MKSILLLYLLIGMNDEYMCRRMQKDSSDVEIFYAEDRVKARVYYDNAITFLKDNKINEPIKVSVTNGGHISFQNKFLADIINSKYTERAVSGKVLNENSLWVDNIESCMNKEHVANLSKEGKKHYLIGLYIKHERNKIAHDEKESCMIFINSYNQVESSVSLLMEFGYKKVTFERSNDGSVPSSFKVCFDNSYDPVNLLSNFSKQNSVALDYLSLDKNWGVVK